MMEARATDRPGCNGNLQLVELIEGGWNGKHILVVGDVMLDKYIYGNVDRISPEAPVPVVHALRRSQQPGGAANVAMNVQGLGGKASVVGFVGDDQDGSSLVDLLKAGGIEAHLICVQTTPTTSKLRILAGSQQVVRLDIETKAPRPPEAYASLLERVLGLLPDVDGVVLSDYAKGALSAEICQAIIGEARKVGVPVMVDPKGRDFARYRGATTISPNLQELAIATGDSGASTEAILDRGRILSNELGIDYLAVTLGPGGIMVFHAENRFRAPAVAKQVFDVSGAGDTVIATLALSASCGLAIEEAVRLANVAAGIVVGKLGTVPIARHEFIAALTEFSGTHAQEKTLDIGPLLRRAAEWRASGRSIVFTNGCFDILHIGHIALLEHCRQLGGKVVVGINSDASVARLKGPTRPIVGERERASILAALAATDAIILFESPTPIDLILALRPDVLVKGGDYEEKSIVGAVEVCSWGGRVVIIPNVEGFSTTTVVRKMTERAGS
jgi:D-beta-D-heptose 7-phosphate kinase/D-beta-D-heptose 1-phosphate adenosyltransferase